MERKTWALAVEYSVALLAADSMEQYFENRRKIDRQLYDAVGSPSSASGTGFGLRDHSWYFDTRREAQAALARLRENLTPEQLATLEVYEPYSF